MLLRKPISVLAGFLFVWLLIPQTSTAQWGIGGSFEIRDEVPENGFGVRVEKGILGKVPVLDLKLRAHFSYFSEDNQITLQAGNLQTNVNQEINDFDYGIAAIGGISVGLVKPYFGLGIGSNTVDINVSDPEQNLPGINPPDSEDENKFYWNALAGAEVSAIPVIKPFVEYRFSKLSGAPITQQDIPSPGDSNGRVVFGVLITF